MNINKTTLKRIAPVILIEAGSLKDISTGSPSFNEFMDGFSNNMSHDGDKEIESVEDDEDSWGSNDGEGSSTPKKKTSQEEEKPKGGKEKGIKDLEINRNKIKVADANSKNGIPKQSEADGDEEEGNNEEEGEGADDKNQEGGNSERELDDFVSVIHEKLGLEFDSDEYKKHYEDSPEGIAQFIRDAVTQSAEGMLDDMPYTKKVWEIEKQGGNPADVFGMQSVKMDYDKIDLEDEATQDMIFKKYYKETTQFTDARINKLLQTSKDLNEIGDEVKEFATELKAIENKREAEKIQSEKARLEQQRQNNEKYWNEVKTTLQKSEDFEGMNIPKEQRNKLYDYITKPVEKDANGRWLTAFDKKNRENAGNIPRLLKLAYLDMVDYKTADLERKVTTKVARDMKDKLRSFGDTKAKSSSRGDRSEHFSNNNEALALGNYNDFL